MARIDTQTGECSVTGPDGEPIEVLGVPSITGLRYSSAVEPLAPFSESLGRACLGIAAWRVLEELRHPLHRRASMSRAWIKAMQPRYLIPNHNTGKPPHEVPGNQRGVLEAFERIRREAGDFDAEEMAGLN